MPKKTKASVELQQLSPPKIILRTKDLSDRQKDLVRLAVNHSNKIVFISGPAGSTKTYVAVYSALRQLKGNDDLDLLYVRTVIESADKGLGALPGDIGEKFNPYIAPLEDKLRELLPASTGVVGDLIKKQRVQAIPINFLRGANWINKIVIADEAQNFTFKELITLITRLGQNSQLFICGDYMQSDINGKSGFKDMFELFDDPESKEKGIQCFSFGLKDIKRSPLLSYIIKKLSSKLV